MNIQIQPFERIKQTHFIMGSESANQNSTTCLSVCNEYFIKNNKPWYPVMAEFHFTRYNPEDWEMELEKMKAGGVEIVAFYLFWIFHEEQEGVFNFTFDRDLRTFVKSCQKVGLYVALRPGPWAHGEARNGGFPDWIFEKTAHMRTNDPVYLQYVDRLYQQYAEQVKGLLFKEDGPIILLQVDNELVNQPDHLLTLKKIAQKHGLDVPYYTVTGWSGNGVIEFPKNEVLPLFGGYPDAPWDDSLHMLPPSTNFYFEKGRNNTDIGNDQIKVTKRLQDEQVLKDYPYATCETGPGIQVTHHRRPVIDEMDVYTLPFVSLAKGNNLTGYYVYHGGRNPSGALGLYQESKDTSYPNDCPVISYDFQAPLSEYGFKRPSFDYLKLLHMFMHLHSELLPTLHPFYPDTTPKSIKDPYTPRVLFRSNEQGQGFLFFSTYHRNMHVEKISDLHLSISLPDGTTYTLPRPLSIPRKRMCAFPFHMQYGDLDIEFATVQPLLTTQNQGITTLFCFEVEGVAPYIKLKDKDIVPLTPSLHVCFKEKNTQIVLLSFLDALKMYTQEKRVYLTDDLLIEHHNTPTLFGALRSAPLLFDHTLQAFKQLEIEKKDYVPDIFLQNSDIKMRFQNKYTKYLFTDKLTECNEYTLHVPKDVFAHCHDVKLSFLFSGDVLQVYANNLLLADAFNTGEPLVMGLKRFKEQIENGETLRIKISPMGNKQVYLERYVDRTHTSLELFHIEPIYVQTL